MWLQADSDDAEVEKIKKKTTKVHIWACEPHI